MTAALAQLARWRSGWSRVCEDEQHKEVCRARASRAPGRNVLARGRQDERGTRSKMRVAGVGMAWLQPRIAGSFLLGSPQGDKRAKQKAAVDTARAKSSAPPRADIFAELPWPKVRSSVTYPAGTNCYPSCRSLKESSPILRRWLRTRFSCRVLPASSQRLVSKIVFPHPARDAAGHS